mmetsp:Transcript_11130/g.22153  ORF Transcript_11130/g.22153 Transcript_11130/m.22153 type:complete len:165 (-) Transcript_11130:813-1307(-)
MLKVVVAVVPVVNDDKKELEVVIAPVVTADPVVLALDEGLVVVAPVDDASRRPVIVLGLEDLVVVVAAVVSGASVVDTSVLFEIRVDETVDSGDEVVDEDVSGASVVSTTLVTAEVVSVLVAIEDIPGLTVVVSGNSDVFGVDIVTIVVSELRTVEKLTAVLAV